MSDLGQEGNTSIDVTAFTGLAYAASSPSGTLNTFHVSFSGQDDRGSQLATENEIYHQHIEPVLEITKTMTSAAAPMGIDGGDVIQYTIVIEHKEVDEGAHLGIDVSLRDAFNLDITDDLDMLENATIVSALLDDGSGVISDISGLLGIDVNGDLETTGDIDLDHDFTTPGGDHESITIVISATVPNDKGPDDVVATGNTATVTWENRNSVVSTDAGSHPQLDDSSTESTALTFSDPFSVDKSADVANATIGDVITYTVTVTVVEGTTTNLQFIDTLPAGTTYVAASAGVSNANGMTISGLTDNGGPAGQVLTIDITSVLNTGNQTNPAVTETDDFTFTYQVTVDYDPTNVQDGTQLTNDLDATADGVAADNNSSFMVGIQAGTIIIAKTTTPAGGTGFGFDSSDANFPAAVVNSFTLNDTQTETIAGLPVPLDYDVIEDDPTVSPGSFALANIVCTGENGGTASTVDIPNRKATINLDDGETVTCTYTNAQLGTINIVKDTVPDAAQDFSFTDDIAAPNAFMLDDDADGTLLDTETFNNVAPGTFTVTEAAVAGYSTAVSCADPDNGSTMAGTNAATIDLDGGETITCSFTNTLLGTINIIKDTVPNAAQDFSFTDDIAAPNAFMLDDDADGTLLDTETFNNVAPGTFMVTEAAVAGYSTAVSCVDPDSGSTLAGTNVATIDLDAGETTTYRPERM